MTNKHNFNQIFLIPFTRSKLFSLQSFVLKKYLILVLISLWKQIAKEVKYPIQTLCYKCMWLDSIWKTKVAKKKLKKKIVG